MKACIGEIMICPWRKFRRMSATIQGDFQERFCDCITTLCPCYKEIGEEKWCYRDSIRLPLNDVARKQDSEVTE